MLQQLAGRTLSSCWTTPAIAAQEASLLRAADRANERDWISPAVLEDVLTDAECLSSEQAEAVRLACNRDGVTICEAAAGTGKTTLTRVLVQAAQQSGLTVIGLAPTWVAADELSASIGILSVTIAKWRFDLRANRSQTLTPHSLVLVDEVGMCGLADLEDILRTARQSNSKVVLLGDRRQLEAVPNGNPLKAIAEITNKSATMSQVRRQLVDWQRAASVVMATGDVEGGLRAYARNGRVRLVSGESQFVEQTIGSWQIYVKNLVRTSY